jgi:hypothetical protein
MCIIIDANVATEVTSGSDDAKPVIKAITSGALKIASGHQLKTELLRCSFKHI